MNEWISTKDRLPDVGVPVLIYAPYMEYDGIAIGTRYQEPDRRRNSYWTWLAYWIGERGFIHTPMGHGTICPGSEYVTHWMPLPETPKMKAASDMTGSEIIKELQSAADWLREHGRNTNTAIIGICERAVDLIKRQEAELDELAEEHSDLIVEKDKLFDEADKLKVINKLLEQDIADRDEMLEAKVEEVYPEFMRDYKCMREELDGLYDEYHEAIKENKRLTGCLEEASEYVAKQIFEDIKNALAQMGIEFNCQTILCEIEKKYTEG